MPEIYAVVRPTSTEPSKQSSLWSLFGKQQTSEVITESGCRYPLTQVDFFSHLTTAKGNCRQEDAIFKLEIKNNNIVEVKAIYKQSISICENTVEKEKDNDEKIEIVYVYNSCANLLLDQVIDIEEEKNEKNSQKKKINVQEEDDDFQNIFTAITTWDIEKSPRIFSESAALTEIDKLWKASPEYAREKEKTQNQSRTLK